jgi:IclR family transcriptional regulator, acetate operon repressor
VIATEAQLFDLYGDGPLPPRTRNTITTLPALWDELEQTRERGYGVDDQENEDGINCIAVPISLNGGTARRGAVSVSGLAFRTPLRVLVKKVQDIRGIVRSAESWSAKDDGRALRD